MEKSIKKEIRKWIKDFEKTKPGNVSVDEDTFEGSAYYLFLSILSRED